MRTCGLYLIVSALTLAGCSATVPTAPDCQVPAPAVEVQHPLALPPYPVEVST